LKGGFGRLMPLTNSSTAKQEEKQVERGSCQTLVASDYDNITNI